MKIKKFSRTVAGRTMIWGAMLALLMASFGPMLKVFATAPANTSGYVVIDLNHPISLENKENVPSITAGYANGTMTVSGAGLFSDGNGTIWAPSGSNVTFDATGNENYVGTIFVGGENTNGSTKTLENLSGSNAVVVEAVFTEEEEQSGDGSETATVTVSVGDGTYQIQEYNPEQGQMVLVDRNYDDMANFEINDSRWDPSSPTISYHSAGDTVTFVFESLWNEEYYDEIIINNNPYVLADYGVDYDDKAWWLEHNYGTQVVWFSIPGVTKDDHYDIVVKHGENNGERFIGNFLWTADPAQAWKIVRDGEGNMLKDGEGNYIYELDDNGERIPNEDNYIGHASIKLVAVSYDLNNHTYACNLDTDTCTDESHNENEGGSGCVISENPDCASNIMPYVRFESDPNLEYDDGSLVVPSDAFVTMEIVPDYGYQILNVNMSDLTVSEDGVGRFTFRVPAGAAYFKSDVVEMEDRVSTSTTLVTGGEINLGEDQTTFDHGTAQLNVADVDLSDEDIAGFEEAADGYEVKNYLDISLFNVTCKGADTCTGSDEDSWNEQVKDLNEPATITLQLDEGVDGNEIVIVHQKHDGTYEVIPTEYDPATNTITFTTTSFSNYAIASRTVVSPETGANVQGDTSATASATYIIVANILVGVIMFVLRKKFVK